MTNLIQHWPSLMFILADIRFCQKASICASGTLRHYILKTTGFVCDTTFWKLLVSFAPLHFEKCRFRLRHYILKNTGFVCATTFWKLQVSFTPLHFENYKYIWYLITLLTHLIKHLNINWPTQFNNDPH